MTPAFADSHCHLAMLDDASVDATIDRARSEGVSAFMVPATQLQDAPRVVEIAATRGNVWSAVGFHPHEAKDCDEAAFATIAGLATNAKVRAVGEVGLDYHYMHSPRETQREVFARHLALGRELDLPVIVHNRESTEDMLEMLLGEAGKGSRGVLHSFTESYDVARKLVDAGWMISFSGIATFRTAETIRDAAARLPHDRVLIETDTPYLAPVPHRGKQNEPAYVVRIAELLASLWKAPLDEVARVTSANFEELFRVTIQQ